MFPNLGTRPPSSSGDLLPGGDLDRPPQSSPAIIDRRYSQLDAERLAWLPPGETVVEDDARRENRGKQVRHETDGQRYSKPLDRTGAESKKDRRGDHSGYVRVDDGLEGVLEASGHGGPDGLAVPQLLPDALEDEYVRVHAHADGQNNTGDAGQCQHSPKIG